MAWIRSKVDRSSYSIATRLKFENSEAQYKRKLKQWGFLKYNKRSRTSPNTAITEKPGQEEDTDTFLSNTELENSRQGFDYEKKFEAWQSTSAWNTLIP